MGMIDLTGQRFGRLTVLEEAGRNKHRDVLWCCKCDCKAEVIVSSDSLRSGKTQSCGCFQRDRTAECNTKHGMCKTRLFHIWQHILVRVGINKGANEQTKRAYQDRGITVCTEWKTFENFRDWALSHGYSERLEIDRIDNDKGYEPSNCRWIVHKENCNNRRCTLRLDEGTPLATFCSEIGIQTRENGGISKLYNKISHMYRTSHKAHPELITKANNLICLYRKCVETLRLLDEVKQLRRNLNK